MRKQDVQEFNFRLEDNLFELHENLKQGTYRHGKYKSFFVHDPKLRHIHKASVRDRVLHQAVYRILYPLFDRTFIHNSYSSRVDRGTHAASRRLQSFARKVTGNYSTRAFALKCDIRKFFDTVDHGVLLGLIKGRVSDADTLWLITEILRSYHAAHGKGLPLGNVTSQLFANIYLNRLDQFAKHILKVKRYLRYCDDFILVDQHQGRLTSFIPKIRNFLFDELHLTLHSDKIFLRKISQGIDFVGYVILPHHCVLRTKTKRRILKKLAQKVVALQARAITLKSFNQSLQSYYGILEHCDSWKLRREIEEISSNF